MKEHFVMGAFRNRHAANAAVGDLQGLGFEMSDISVMYKGDSGELEAASFGETLAVTAKDTAKGAATGGAIGGLAGLIASALPFAAGVFVGGPLALALGLTGSAAAVVTSVATGIAAGGLIGGLAGLGMSESTAQEYDRILADGGVALGVAPGAQPAERIERVLRDHGGEHIAVVNYARGEQ